MGFELKTFPALVSGINEAVKIILQRDKVIDVTKIPNENRRFQIQFLTALSTSLELSNNQANGPTTSLNSVYALYAGLVLVAGEITSSGSTLRASILETIMDNKQLSAHQLSTAYQELNQHLLSFFNEENITKGLKTENPFSSLDQTELLKLIQTSFKNELAANIKEIDQLTNKSEKVAGPYNIFDYVSELLVSRFPDFEIMGNKLDSVRITELANHDVPAIKSLPQARFHQFAFMTAINDLLNSSENGHISESQKKAILAGAMCLVCSSIQDSYKLTAATASVTYNELDSFLDFKNMSRNDMAKLVGTTQDFVRHFCVAVSDEKAIRSKNPFSDYSNFNVNAFLKDMHKLICDCRTKDIESLTSTQASKKSYLGSLGGSINRTLFGGGSSSSTKPNHAELVLGSEASTTNTI